MKDENQPGAPGAPAGKDVSDTWLERLAAGDLPPEQAEALRARVLAEPAARERLARLHASNEEILRANPPAVVVPEIERRLGRGMSSAVAAASSSSVAATSAPATPKRGRATLRGLQFSFGLPVLAGFAVLFLVARGGLLPTGGRSGARPAARADNSGDTLKGLRPSLRVYRKAAGRVERLQDGAPTRAGDELQLAYVAAGHRYGAVVSADGAGHVTFHLPAAAGPAVRLRTDGETVLPSAYELDAAPGFERFVFLSSDEPFDASILAEVASGRAPAPAGKVAVVFTVRKP